MTEPRAAACRASELAAEIVTRARESVRFGAVLRGHYLEGCSCPECKLFRAAKELVALEAPAA